jgi:hypothetical protein
VIAHPLLESMSRAEAHAVKLATALELEGKQRRRGGRPQGSQPLDTLAPSQRLRLLRPNAPSG